MKKILLTLLMSGLLSGCYYPNEEELLTAHEVIAKREVCKKSGASSYKLANDSWFVSHSKKVTRVICLYTDPESGNIYEKDSSSIKADKNGN